MIVKRTKNGKISFSFNENGRGLVKIHNNDDGDSVYIDARDFIEGVNMLQALSTKDQVEDEYTHEKRNERLPR